MESSPAALTSDSKKSKKVHFYVTPESLVWLDQLVRQAGFASRAHLFRASVRLFQVLWNAVNDPERQADVILRDKDGTEYIVPIWQG